MRLSPTRLKTFGECANQYKYQYVLKLEGEQKNAYTVLGSVFHMAIEVYELHDHNIDLALRTFSHYWNHPEDMGERIDFYPPRTTHRAMEESGLEMLQRYHELEPWKGGIILGTEVRFEVPLGLHTLVGVIDKLYLRPQKREIQVIDFKTGYKVPERLRFNLQFTSYMYATTRPEFWASVPGYEDFWMDSLAYPRLGQWYHARSHKMLNAGFRDDLDYRRLLLAADQMAAACEADIFPLTISGEACGYCSWVDICGTEVDSPNSDLSATPELLIKKGA